MNIGDDSSTESVAGDEMQWGMKGISKRKMYISKDGRQAQPVRLAERLESIKLLPTGFSPFIVRRRSKRLETQTPKVQRQLKLKSELEEMD